MNCLTSVINSEYDFNRLDELNLNNTSNNKIPELNSSRDNNNNSIIISIPHFLYIFSSTYFKKAPENQENKKIKENVKSTKNHKNDKISKSFIHI